jgi:predicted oxidoreductase
MDPNEKMFAANTLEELAEYLGFTGEKQANFVESIRRYNEFCVAGRDDDFGKDPRILLPVDKPPYYAFRRHAQVGNEFLATVDGLWTDERQNVLNQQKEPIPGLYATGNCCGRRWGIQYSTPIPGVSIGMAWTLGRICGRNAAEG